MSKIKSKNTKIELIVRRAIHNLGFRFRLNYNNLPGKPDIVLPKYKSVIFVHGCYWHRHSCKRGKSKPKTNKLFWEKKFANNISNDKMVIGNLKRLGWNVLVLWECQIKKDDNWLNILIDFLNKNK
jgi:DNA mismatch endonuclease (patch repair protein)